MQWTEQVGTAGTQRTIRQLREERGESTMALAKVLGVSLAEIKELEDGRSRPSAVRLRQMAEHFGVDASEIALDPTQPPESGEQLLEASILEPPLSSRSPPGTSRRPAWRDPTPLLRAGVALSASSKRSRAARPVGHCPRRPATR
jgi:transcriptional regulator with XRE-family HTH domain